MQDGKIDSAPGAPSVCIIQVLVNTAPAFETIAHRIPEL
jgi:hypothetical protein